MAQVKTNAMRILDSKKFDYKVINYDSKDGRIDGASVAEKIGKSEKFVYKTLVTQGVSKELYVLVIPVLEELDLKKVAKITGEKKVEMIPVKDITKYTGYIRGGCSPVGMKKQYRTFINDSAKELEYIVVSGGKVGIQIELSPDDLLNCIEATFQDIVK